MYCTVVYFCHIVLSHYVFHLVNSLRIKYTIVHFLSIFWGKNTLFSSYLTPLPTNEKHTIEYFFFFFLQKSSLQQALNRLHPLYCSPRMCKCNLTVSQTPSIKYKRVRIRLCHFNKMPLRCTLWIRSKTVKNSKQTTIKIIIEQLKNMHMSSSDTYISIRAQMLSM